MNLVGFCNRKSEMKKGWLIGSRNCLPGPFLFYGPMDDRLRLILSRHASRAWCEFKISSSNLVFSI